MKKYTILVPLIIFALISAAYAFPIFKNISYWGKMDWDQFTFLNAVPWVTISRFCQFPLWNPYSNGGNVILAHPYSSFISPSFAFILFFGPVVGLKASWVFHLFFGMFGMFLLGKNLGLEKTAQYLAPGVFMLSSMFTLHLLEGHTEWMVMAFLPWFFLFFLKTKSEKKYLFLPILFLSLMILGGSVDVLNIVIIFITIYSLLRSFKERSAKYIILLLSVFLFTFLICSVKLIPLLEFVEKNPRKTVNLEEKLNIGLIPSALLSRDQALLYENTKETNPQRRIKFKGREFEYGWHEYGAYVGFISLILAAAGLFFCFKQRWPLFAAGAICLWISLGKGAFYNLWSLVHKLPLYDSLSTPSRYLLGFLFSLSIFAGFGLSRIEKAIKGKCGRWPIIIVIGFVFLDLLLVNYPLLKNTFTLPPPKVKKYSEFRQRYKDLNIFPGRSRSAMFPALLSNSGVLHSYEVINVKPGRVMVEGEKGYKGEVYLLDDNGQVDIIKQTPNCIEIEANLPSSDTLVVNQNFYTGWKVKGINGNAQPYRGLISVKAPAGRHKIVFYYLPTSFIFGSILTLLSMLCLSAFSIKLYKRKKKITIQ